MFLIFNLWWEIILPWGSINVALRSFTFKVTTTYLNSGEEVDSPAEEVEDYSPEELAEIAEEAQENEEEAFRAERWPAYVKYVDSLVSHLLMSYSNDS